MHTLTIGDLRTDVDDAADRHAGLWPEQARRGFGSAGSHCR